ncbi:hypothetical protein Rsub_02243 [Raphidocelis subcapitata]|uniref:Uncharacterized protein n=1 Tax=Raphidocelis subcapitata TaxID=307507 RepID=A0A2V0NXH8_9CHLO|nr:hypothetical protein Rsub_02243 [Raphidocelis subcapitata]|eukprot:GBF89525.1 hypothetical protein Rsub_02243 [Raphidocelis subcapitata]
MRAATAARAAPRAAALPSKAAPHRAPAFPPRAARRAPLRVTAFREDEGPRPDTSRPSPLKRPAGLGGVPLSAPTALRPSRHAAAALALAAGAVGFCIWPHQVMSSMFEAGTAVGGAMQSQTARLLGVAMGAAAATNIAESRAGGRAGGPAEPKLEADTHSRLDRSLGAFGLASVIAAALSFTPLAARMMPGHAAGAALLSPPAMGVIGALGALQWWVSGMASPITITKSLLREVLSTLSGTPNMNAGAYGLMGAAFLASGLAYMAAPAATLAGVFGGAAAGVPAAAGLLWMVVGAALSGVTAGACYALKEGAAYKDLSESKFKWLNFGLAATALAHVLILVPYAAGQGGPMAQPLMALWAAALLLGGVNAFA